MTLLCFAQSWVGLLRQPSETSPLGIWLPLLCLLSSLAPVHSPSASEDGNADTLPQSWED